MVQAVEVSASWPAISSLAAAASAGIAALAAWQARQTAGTLARIEQDRFQRETAPVFRVFFQADAPQPGFGILFILFMGGPADALDSVQVTLLDTMQIVPEFLPDGITEDEARRWIWAGWQFNTFYSVPGALALNPRQSHPRPYSRKDGQDWEQLYLYETTPPPWHKLDLKQWQERWRDRPLRLRIDCRVGDSELPPVYRSIEVKRAGGTPTAPET